jgi:glycosyltransferase involved in cell wall biosynthesis
MQDREFQQEVIKKIDPPKICIAIDGQGYSLFEAWRGKASLVLDLSIALPQYFLVTENGESYHPAMLNPNDEFHQRLYRNYFKEIELADLILCGSEFVKKSVVFFKPEYGAKCKVLPYGVNTALFDYPDRTYFRKKNLKFVSVGTVDHRKGSDILLTAWETIHKLYPEAELHFFGTVHLEDYQLTSTLPMVTFHGRVAPDVLVQALKAMDVFILPSLHEGSSIAVYQAMAMALPIITTFNSGTVLSHGESCIMIPPKNIQATIDAMILLYENDTKREYLGRNAYLLSKEYTWTQYRERLQGILRELSLI